MIYVPDTVNTAAVRAEMYNLGLPTAIVRTDELCNLTPSDFVITDGVDLSAFTSARTVRRADAVSLLSLFGGDGKIYFDGELYVWRERICLTRAEKMIVKSLMTEHGRVMSAEIIAEVAYVKPSAIRVHVAEINRAVGAVTSCRIIEAGQIVKQVQQCCEKKLRLGFSSRGTYEDGY